MTEGGQAASPAAAARELLSELSATAPEVVLLSTDRQGRVTSINAVAAAALGRAVSETPGLLGAPLSELVAVADGRVLEALLTGPPGRSGPRLVNLVGVSGSPLTVRAMIEVDPAGLVLAGFRTTNDDASLVDRIVRLNNQMAASTRESARTARELTRTTAELRESEGRFREVLENSLDASYRRDLRSGGYTYMSQAIARISGYTSDEMKALPLEGALALIHPADVAEVDRVIAEAMSSSSSAPFELEYRFKDKAGVYRWLRDRFVVVLDARGRPSALIGSVSDISDRNAAQLALRESYEQLEKRVAERTAALVEANRELDAYSYSISHELRSPLRAIDGFSALIARAYDGMLDDEGRRLLGEVRWNAQRMGRLIDDLLAFSRAGRTDLSFGPVDMTRLAKEAFASAVPDPSLLSRISLSVDALPEAEGDGPLLELVWESLLSNASKFSAGRATPEIRVEGKIESDEVVYRVRDNGIGFDMKFVDKLFGMFHRLHGQRELEGTGVGLALVRRIVVRHGGRVWAEGEVGRGATFAFSLPVGLARDRSAPHQVG